MQRVLCTLVLLVLGAVVPLDVTAEGPIGFDSTGAVTYVNGEYYLTVPEVNIAGTDFWVIWKFNWTNAAWDLFAGDLTANVKGRRTASGRYIFNAEKRILILDFTSSDFQGCGPRVEESTMYVESLSATTLRLREPFDDFSLTMIRPKGSPGDVIILGYQNTHTKISL